MRRGRPESFVAPGDSVWLWVGRKTADGFQAGRRFRVTSAVMARFNWTAQQVHVQSIINNWNHYRFAYNGQERIDEKAGRANYYTAPYWEYDPRRATRDNPDPVIKFWQSTYAVFSGNPIWRMDPLGDDDYYNYAGKWVGNDGKGNALRLTTAPSISSFNKRLSDMGIDRMKEMSREIKVQSNDQVKAILNDIKVKSNDQQVERKAYIILNTDTR